MADLRVSKSAFAIFIAGGYMLADIVSRCFYVPQILLSLSWHLYVAGLVFLTFRGDTGKKVLTASMIITAVTLTGNFSGSFFSCLALFWRHRVNNIEVPFISEREGCIIGFVSLAVSLWAVNSMGKYKDTAPTFCPDGGMDIQRSGGKDAGCFGSGYPGREKWYLMLSLPLLAITAVADVAAFGASKGISVRSGGNMGLYYDQIFSHLEFCVLTALSMFAAGFYVLGMNRIYLEQQKSSQYQAQVAAYKMLEEQYSRSERLRHDMKNHMRALSGLLEKREWEKMTAYLNKMNDSSGLLDEDEVTGNRVVDVLLTQKRKLAESRNILWECDVQMPGKCCISEFDLCVLFGNILDNAVEACGKMQDIPPHGQACERMQDIPPHGQACEGQWDAQAGDGAPVGRRFINIQAKSVKKCFLLEVKNSTDLKETEEAGAGEGKRRKGHGIGLMNVRDVVQSYHGAMNIKVGEGAFVITVLIPQNDAAYDRKQTV